MPISSAAPDARLAGGVRACAAGDVPAIVALRRRIWPTGPDAAVPDARLGELFVGHPFTAPGIGSLVYEARGEVVGCIGVLARRMRWRQESIVVAISHNFMVDPGRRGTLAGVALLRAFFAGPQQLAVADGNDAAAAVWLGLGGARAPLPSVGWWRPVRPAAWLAHRLLGRRARAVRAVAGALADAVDALTPRIAGGADADAHGEPLSPATMAAALPEMARGAAVRPDYDEPGLATLFAFLEAKRARGRLRAVGVRDDTGSLLGWHVSLLRPSGEAEVAQIAARNGAEDAVLAHLLRDARMQGATAVSGRIEPGFTQALARQRCLLRDDGRVMLVHARNRVMLETVLRGEAFLSRLDTEWWIGA